MDPSIQQQSGFSADRTQESAQEAGQQIKHGAEQQAGEKIKHELHVAGVINIKSICTNCNQPSLAPPDENVICPHCRSMFHSPIVGERISDMSEIMIQNIKEAMPSLVAGHGG